MNIRFPSREFDDAVAAACDGSLTEAPAVALGAVLRADPLARDEYIHRVALHAALASNPDLFLSSAPAGASQPPLEFSEQPSAAGWDRTKTAWWRWPTAADRWRTLALAAAIALLLGSLGWLTTSWGGRKGETSRAVAMLNRAVNARWGDPQRAPKLGAPLEPGLLRLDSGLAQVVFYNGARVVIEGPTELKLVSSMEAVCNRGVLTAEVPPQAQGFRILSPRFDVTDRGTAFGLKVGSDRSELHVFEGRVEFRADTAGAENLTEGNAALLEGQGKATRMPADRAGFAGLFDLQAKSVAADARRYDEWRESIRKLRRDSSLWVHLDFEQGGAPTWRLPNAGARGKVVPDATIVGCEWREGRWATKPALEFRGVSDRVRVHVPGEFDSVTLAAWVRVQGLDRQINSLFMSDGFAPGTLHWVLRHDGVLGLTAIGTKGGHQILASPAVMTIDRFGIWTHLAVVLDGRARQVIHYVNGQPVSRQSLRIDPPFHIGGAELGNWTAHTDAASDPFLIRNFSGAVDEFCLFNRPLSSDEIRALHADGRPQADLASVTDPAVENSAPLVIASKKTVLLDRTIP